VGTAEHLAAKGSFQDGQTAKAPLGLPCAVTPHRTWPARCVTFLAYSSRNAFGTPVLLPSPLPLLGNLRSLSLPSAPTAAIAARRKRIYPCALRFGQSDGDRLLRRAVCPPVPVRFPPAQIHRPASTTTCLPGPPGEHAQQNLSSLLGLSTSPASSPQPVSNSIQRVPAVLKHLADTLLASLQDVLRFKNQSPPLTAHVL